MIFVLLVVAFTGTSLLCGLGMARLLLGNERASAVLLLAPATGASVLALLAVTLCYSGLPVATFALPLLGAVVLGNGFVLYRCRFAIPWGAASVAAGTSLGIVLFAAMPGILRGLDWVAAGNGDFLNYALSAHFFLGNAPFRLPPIEPFLLHHDVSYSWWSLYAIAGERPGFNVLLALASAATGIDTLRLYMPLETSTLIALALAAGGAVAVGGNRSGLIVPACACLATALSSEVLDGYVHQLGPQLLGEALLVLLCVPIGLLVVPNGRSREAGRGRDVLAAWVFAALLVSYFEIGAFVFPASALLLLAAAVKRRAAPRAALRSIVLIVAAGVALSAAYLPSFFQKWSQMGDVAFSAFAGARGGVAPSMPIFPYFLLPSGLANFWGLIPIGLSYPEPYSTLAICAGAVGLAALACFAFVRVWQGSIWGAMVAVMLCASFDLFKNGQDFGLFKLAMYVQPFAACCVFEAFRDVRAAAPERALRVEIAAALSLLLFAAANLPGTLTDRAAYLDTVHGKFFTTLPGSSEYGVLDQFSDMRAAAGANPIVFEGYSYQLWDYAAFLLRDRAFVYPTNWRVDLQGEHGGPLPFYERLNRYAGLINAKQHGYFERIEVPAGGEAARNKAVAYLDAANRRTAFALARADPKLLEVGPHFSVLNRSYPWSNRGDFVLKDLRSVANRVVFVDSSLGVTDSGRVRADPAALGLIEHDPMFPGGLMATLGRYAVFELLNPSKRIRIVMSFTETLDQDGSSRLPPASVAGLNRVRFRSVGRGAARWYSDPIVPATVAGHSYFVLDAGTALFRFPERRTGAMRWYGLDVPSSDKVLTGFLRNVSAVPAQDADGMQAPQGIASFPDGLRDERLEFSGVYEDGWVAEDSYFVLRSVPGAPLRIRGMLPGFSPAFTNTLRLRVDGATVAERRLRPGPFDIVVPRGFRAGRHVVALHFENVHRLGPRDPRPASAYLTSLEFGRDAHVRPRS
jgi:hypothetical protein